MLGLDLKCNSDDLRSDNVDTLPLVVLIKPGLILGPSMRWG